MLVSWTHNIIYWKILSYDCILLFPCMPQDHNCVIKICRDELEMDSCKNYADGIMADMGNPNDHVHETSSGPIGKQ